MQPPANPMHPVTHLPLLPDSRQTPAGMIPRMIIELGHPRSTKLPSLASIDAFIPWEGILLQNELFPKKCS